MIEVVVFPTPPFWLATQIVRLTLPSLVAKVSREKDFVGRTENVSRVSGNPNQISDLLKCQVVVSELGASRSFDQKTSRNWVSRGTGEGLANSDFFSVRMFHAVSGNVSIWAGYSGAALRRSKAKSWLFKH